MTPDQKFAEMFEICWHEPLYPRYDKNYMQCSCGSLFDHYGVNGIDKHCKKINPDFSDPVAVLELIDEKGMFKEFVVWLTNKLHDETGNSCIALAKLFKDRTGLLRDEVIRWKEAKP